LADWLSIPLVLRLPASGRMVYGLPVWYRAAMAAILGLLVAALAQAGVRPGPLAWVVLALVALALLYEEAWVFEAGPGRVVHRGGLLVAARSTVIPFAEIERLLIVPHVEGTIPGTEDERLENAAALAGRRTDDGGSRRSRHKKPYLDLVLETDGGTRRLMDRVPAREGDRLRGTAAALAELCGKPLDIAEP
jgi:hypothetical protein